VPTEIRAITRDEAVEYLKVLPYANGLPHWEPAPAAWYGGAGAWPPPRPPASEQELAALAGEIMADGVHPQAAFVDGRIVGGSAMFSLEITVPGLRLVPFGGVTSTGVIATHRRRGLLRAMMQAMFDNALGRGEPVAALSASEGGIYGRFGFSPGTVRTRWEIDRAEAALRDAPPPAGSAELAGAAAARAAWPGIHDTARRGQVGEISAPAGRWDGLSDDAGGPDGPLRYVIHRDPRGQADGIASYRLPWSPRLADTGTLVVEGITAASGDAYRALWQLLLDFDLTRRVVAAGRPADEPLRWMLRNPRAMRVTRQSDNLWIRLLDIPAALRARGYDTAASLSFTVESDAMCPGNEGTWRLDTTGPASCVRSGGAADVTLDIAALGSLYLGGMSAAILAGAGLVRPHHDAAVSLLSRIFRTDPAPFNAVGF
jgi:predicted acetyltransferase